MAQNFSLTRSQRPSGVHVGDADRRVLERAAKPLLALPQRLLARLRSVMSTPLPKKQIGFPPASRTATPRTSIQR